MNDADESESSPTPPSKILHRLSPVAVCLSCWGRSTQCLAQKQLCCPAPYLGTRFSTDLRAPRGNFRILRLPDYGESSGRPELFQRQRLGAWESQLENCPASNYLGYSAGRRFAVTLFDCSPIFFPSPPFRMVWIIVLRKVPVERGDVTRRQGSIWPFLTDEKSLWFWRGNHEDFNW